VHDEEAHVEQIDDPHLNQEETFEGREIFHERMTEGV
jgi:hypothetical protein